MRQTTSGGVATILVIDDDGALRGVMRKVLERAGHSVVEAEDGSVGLPLIETTQPDIVVTDLLMPEKEGIETIMELRERFPDLAIVAVSGAGGGEDARPLADARMLGASATFPKPFLLEDFLSTIERIIPPR